MGEPFDFNPLDPGFRRDPFPRYERGRREFPAFAHQGLPLRLVSVFRYEDVQAILRDGEIWSNRFFPLALKLGVGGRLPPPSMLGSDGAEHARLRALVNEAFSPRIVQRLEPRMLEIAEELVAAALEAGEVDLVQALSYPLPVTVIAEIIGIPVEDRERFKRWSDEAVASLGLGLLADLDPGRVQRRLRLLEEMRAYFVPLAEARAREPQEDLLTGLVHAEHEGSRLSHDELLMMLVLILVAGNETTTTLIGNAVLALLEHPGELARVRGDPGLLRGAIEEVLRFASPVQFDPRRATRDLSLHGVEIRENDFALCWIGSANRDEKVFEEPGRFDVSRRRNPHLAFGFGAHYCLGANLARLEARAALSTLLARTRRFELASSDELPLHSSPVFRSAAKIPLRLEPA